MCAEYGNQGHPIQERTVLVGYACENHSQYATESVLADGGYSDSGYGTGSGRRRTTRTRLSKSPPVAGVGITLQIPTAEPTEDNDGDGDTSQRSTGEDVPSPPEAHFDEEILPPPIVEDPRATDDSTYLEPLRSRLLDSEAYFASLSELEQNVWLNSSLSIQRFEKPNLGSASATQMEPASFVPYPEISAHLLEYSLYIPEPLSDDDVTSLCLDQAAFSALSLLRECRNITMRTYLNLRRLQLAGFCGTQFSILVADKNREDVARLLMVDITEIIELLKNIESWLQDSAKRVRRLKETSSEIVTELIVGTMTNNFLGWLSSFEIFNRLCLGNPDENPLNQVWLYVCMLDMGVVSYAGAHLSEIPSEHYPKDESGVYFIPPLLQSTVAEPASITARRCCLQCLDEFHDGKPVWIFAPRNWNPKGRLYLSTGMKAFADIWGPLWKGIDQKQPNKYAAYIVGNGSIHPWKHDPMRDPLLEKELFCHWVSDETWDEDVGPTLSSNIDQRSLDGSEQLLIGAPAIGVTLDINANCGLSISKARQNLRDMERLCILGATRPYLYSSGSEYQLQVGYSGVNASATKQYKRNAGQTLKKVLVELWSMEPGLRDPRILTDLHGVEVSLCTQNAQRVSLAYLLGLNCMRSLLTGFKWKKEEYKTEHFETLKDPSRESRKSEVAFCEQFEQAVMLCLKMLSKTGMDRKDNFTVFLSSACTPKPELATLVSTEHSWIGLLKDTTTDCAMAAFGDQCLEFKHNVGATCGGIGRSAFLTAIVPNGLAEPLPMTKASRLDVPGSTSWVWNWDVEKLQVGESFWLGERGILRLKSHLTDGVLVTEWRPSGLKTAMKMFVGKEYPHREYTEIDQSGEESVRPIPVIVVSDRARGMGKDGTAFILARK